MKKIREKIMGKYEFEVVQDLTFDVWVDVAAVKTFPLIFSVQLKTLIADCLVDLRVCNV